MGPQVHMGFLGNPPIGSETAAGAGSGFLTGVGAYAALRFSGNTLPLGVAGALGAEFVTTTKGGGVDFTSEARTMYGKGQRIVYAGNKLFTVNPLMGGSSAANTMFGFGGNLGDVDKYFTPRGAGDTIRNPANARGLEKYMGVGLGTGLTLLFGGMALHEGGMEAMPKFIAQEIYANKYGLEASVKHTATGYTPNKLFGTQMGARLGGTMGAYMFSGIGFDIGKSVGEFTTSLFFESETAGNIGGTVGALIGTSAGARLGAFGFSSTSRLAFGMASLGALTMASTAVSTAFSGVYASLRTGFQNKRKMRGLDFAGDSAQMYTNRATTMRQRAVQAMNRSHMNARSAFGQEAQLMHTHRDAFSTYRRL